MEGNNIFPPNKISPNNPLVALVLSWTRDMLMNLDRATVEWLAKLKELPYIFERSFAIHKAGSGHRVNIFWIFVCWVPWKSKDYWLNGFSEKTIVLVGIYNQQFQGTIILMVFDLQGVYDHLLG